MGHDARTFGDQLRTQVPDRVVRRDVFFVDGLGFGLQVDGLPHPAERPKKVDRRRPALAQRLVGLGRPLAKHDAERRRTADGGGAAHHHVADRLGDLLAGSAGNVDLLVRKEALVEELEPVATPADRLDRSSFFQTTRSFPPSTGTCAAVVLAKRGPHISAASSATSLDDTSVRSRLFFLYCSTVRL